MPTSKTSFGDRKLLEAGQMNANRCLRRRRMGTALADDLPPWFTEQLARYRAETDAMIAELEADMQFVRDQVANWQGVASMQAIRERFGDLPEEDDD